MIVLGGQMDFKTLTSVLDKKEYAIQKVAVWVGMLNQNERPKKWFKIRKDGTKVDFEMIQSEEDFEKALDELKVFVRNLRSNRVVDIKLKIGEEYL